MKDWILAYAGMTIYIVTEVLITEMLITAPPSRHQPPGLAVYSRKQNLALQFSASPRPQRSKALPGLFMLLALGLAHLKAFPALSVGQTLQSGSATDNAVYAPAGRIFSHIHQTQKLSPQEQQQILNTLNPIPHLKLAQALSCLMSNKKARFLLAQAAAKGYRVSLEGAMAQSKQATGVTICQGRETRLIDLNLEAFLPMATPEEVTLYLKQKLFQSPEQYRKVQNALRFYKALIHELLHAATIQGNNSIQEEIRGHELGVKICAELFGTSVEAMLVIPTRQQLQQEPAYQIYHALPLDNGIDTYLEDTGLYKPKELNARRVLSLGA